jgi:hypothetical protein
MTNNTTRTKLAAALSLLFLAAGASLAAPSDTAIEALRATGALDRLAAQTGVYNRPASAKTPDFIVDAAWPQLLPHSWLLGQVGGLYVDGHDHVWVYNRPRTMTDEEAGLEDALPGGSGAPADGMGHPRPYGPTADCCKAAPSVLEFDTSGKLLRSWGGPADPGYMASKCKPEQGCIWPNSEHGIYVDSHDNVWVAGNFGAGGAPAEGAAAQAAGGAGRGRRQTPWTTNKDGGDGFVEKFDMDGNFKMRIGGTPRAPATNDTGSGINGTPVLYQPTDMVVDPKTNRLYVSDGYGNRHVLIVDAGSGKFLGSIGAYGNNPVDDAAAKAAGPWMNDFTKGNLKPAFFRNPVHCVKLANDGKLYVCDRGNDRIQVFDTHDPNLGKPCSNPNGEAGKCGFVAEQFISRHTNTAIPGTSVSINFSTDKAQSCLYVGDNSNMTVYIMNRNSLEELGRLGRSGKMAGDFHWLHQVSTDSNGNIYTAEVDTAKRVQKFVRYGATGCSGTGSAVVGGPMAK